MKEKRKEGGSSSLNQRIQQKLKRLLRLTSSSPRSMGKQEKKKGINNEEGD